MMRAAVKTGEAHVSRAAQWAAHIEEEQSCETNRVISNTFGRATTCTVVLRLDERVAELGTAELQNCSARLGGCSRPAHAKRGATRARSVLGASRLDVQQDGCTFAAAGMRRSSVDGERDL